MAKFKKGTELEWMDTVLKKGTISDKLAAHTLLIHETKNWSSLNELIEMVDPRKCRRRCVMAMITLKELFLDSLNISHKNCQITEEEDKKKVRFYYVKFVDNLNRVAFDNLQETRHKAIWILSELLHKYQDNKDYILDKLVNKLGDKVPKLASTAGHFVEKAVNSDKDEIRMRTIKYVRVFLARPNQTHRARFYAVSLLSRIKLIRGNHEMSNELMQIYLDLYTTLMKDDKIDSRMMSAILTGIHRAYPYSKLNNDIFEQHLQTLYTIAHKVNFRMRVVAMTLIKNIVQKRAELNKSPIEDRFYNLVFSQLIAPELHTSSRQESFIGFVLNVINEDTVVDRKEAFIKRMLHVAVNSQPDLANLLMTTITKIKGYNTDLCVINSKDDNMDTDSSSDDDDSNAGSSAGGTAVTSSWVHKKTKTSKGCDLLARNPRAAKPEHLNELYLLRLYYDPKIAEIAQKMMRD
uniref:CCAAT/enhancer-binding protein zeta n=1 Tax=Aceria tosichella TaxID=561515 RepID=A0A6G1SB99_9ACAR